MGECAHTEGSAGGVRGLMANPAHQRECAAALQIRRTCRGRWRTPSQGRTSAINLEAAAANPRVAAADGSPRVTRCRRLVPALCALAAGLAFIQPLAAQQPPSPAQTNPLPTTTAPNPPADPDKSAAPAPQQAIAPPPAGQAAQPADPTRPPLVAKPAEPGDVDEVTLPPSPPPSSPARRPGKRRCRTCEKPSRRSRPTSRRWG